MPIRDQKVQPRLSEARAASVGRVYRNWCIADDDQAEGRGEQEALQMVKIGLLDRRVDIQLVLMGNQSMKVFIPAVDGR